MIQIKPSCSLQDLSPLQCPGEEVRLNLPMLMPTRKRWLRKFKLEGLTRVCRVGSSSPLLTQVHQSPLALHLLCSCRSETGASYLALQNYPREGDAEPSAWPSDQHYCSESRVPHGSPYLFLKCCHPSVFPAPGEACPAFLQICHPEARLACIF